MVLVRPRRDQGGRPGQREAHDSPEALRQPKEALMRLSKGANKKPRYSTNDNGKLAEKLDLTLCAQRCVSFRRLKEFVLDVVQTVP